MRNARQSFSVQSKQKWPGPYCIMDVTLRCRIAAQLKPRHPLSMCM